MTCLAREHAGLSAAVLFVQTAEQERRENGPFDLFPVELSSVASTGGVALAIED